MRTRKLHKHRKAENGAGRQAKIKHLLLPEELIDEMRIYKEAYSFCLTKEKDENGKPIPRKITWEQMLRRWMDNVGRIDTDVKKYVDNFREKQ